MSAITHTPGRRCDACEGFCLHATEGRVEAGLEVSLRLGQRVHHRDYKGQRVTGVVRGLSIDGRSVLANIALDAPIVIPARGSTDGDISIWHQNVPAVELTPFDDRDELLAGLLAALEEARTGLLWYQDRNPGQTDGSDDEAMARIDAAIAKATGSPS